MSEPESASQQGRRRRLLYRATHRGTYENDILLGGFVRRHLEAMPDSELAALDLAMARDFAARAQAAEDPDTANDLARSYQRVARSYRQTLALKTRLRRETIAAEREAPSVRPPADPRALRRRLAEVHGAVTRVVFAELSSRLIVGDVAGRRLRIGTAPRSVALRAPEDGTPPTAPASPRYCPDW